LDTSADKVFFAIDEDDIKKVEEDKEMSESNLSNVFNLEGEDRVYSPKQKQQYKPV
jgi:hypothetical protein